ncbi:MAG: hypothetical protein AAF481_16025 [Acidobacteriota bacterium]
MIPRRPSDLDDPKLEAETAHPIAGAEAVWANVPALRRDFGHLPDAPTTTDGWHTWLARQGGLISATQAAQEVANTRIPIRDVAVTVYRLPRGGRAFSVPLRSVASDYVDPIEGGGLLSLKAVGVKPGVVPEANLFNYSNGLQWLEGVLHEVLIQRVVEKVLRYAGSSVNCLPVYGALDGGFAVRDSEGNTWPAGILVRQAHRRQVKGWDFPLLGSPGQQLMLDTELELRRYGITSTSDKGTFQLKRHADGRLEFLCAHLGGFVPGDTPAGVARGLWERFRTYAEPGEDFIRFKGVAVQFTRFEEGVEPLLLDFGGFRFSDRFTGPLLSLVLQQPSNWGGTINPDSDAYVQPDPNRALDPRYWRAEPLETLSKKHLEGALEALPERLPGPPDDVPYSPVEHVVCRLAQGFTGGTLARQEVASALDHLLALTTESLERG